MTSILKLASALCFCLFSLVCNAQTTSGNLIDNSQWQGATYGADPGGCCASISGSGPLYDTTTGTIMFSYGQSTISQTIGINQALGGTGISVSGYQYNWDYRLISNNGSGGDTLTATISLKNSAGNVAETQNFNYNSQPHDVWLNENGTTTFTNPYTDPQSITLQFTGMDGGFWAGYYGPEIKNISLRATYSSDPCAADPLYSTTCPGYAEAYKNLQCQSNPLYDATCPGYAEAYKAQQCGFNPLYDATCPSYSSVVTGPNIAPNSSPVNIATALSHSGSGITIYGFRYGFDWRRQSGKCYDSFLFFCTDYRTWSNVKPSLTVTDANGNSILSKSWNFSGDGNGSGSVDQTTIFYGTSYNSLNLGIADWSTGVSNVGSVKNLFLRPLMGPDQCALDPLSSTTCSGYAEAFLAQQCSFYALYSPQCPGYNEALQQMIADSMPTGTANTVSGMDTTAATTAESTAIENPVPTAEVTTDVGGAELSTTGEVVVSTGAPEVKETKDVAEEKQTTETTSTANEKTEKKKSTVNALAIAQNAAGEAEATALSVTDAAVTASLSDAANPGDGINLELGTGLTLAGALTPFGLGSNELQVSLVVNEVTNQAARSRQNSVDIDASETALSENSKTETTVELVTSAVESVAEEKTETGSSVRRGGKVEGMEGGADMNELSKAPADFNSYLASQLQDGQFYAAKEIYKNQKNVDNARAFRGLGSDRLHQQMVDEQYNRINN